MKIELSDYNPQWKNIFLREKELLKRTLGNKAVRIEHIGSTAIPGLGAKPIIDILLGVYKLSDAESFIPGMIELGYEYVSKFENVLPERRYFVKRENSVSTHHIHTVELTSEFWRRHILFRDYLRTYPDTKDEYFKVKKELTQKEWNDSNDYAYAKTGFIRKAETEALDYMSKKIETAEAEALYDMYYGAPDEVIRKNGITFGHIGKALALKTVSIPDIIANRIIGLGIYEEADKNIIDKVFNFYKPFDNIFGIQINPLAKPQNLGEILSQRKMVLKSYWNKFYRTT